MVGSRRLISAAAALAAATALVACDPPPPPVTFTVTSLTEGADAAPGDGTCEVTAGAGDCTLGAAVDEANALGTDGAPGGVVISLPAGTAQWTTNSTVTAPDVEIIGAGASVSSFDHGVIEVAAGSRLHLTHVTALRAGGSTGDPGISVLGELRVRRSRLNSLMAVVTVRPGGGLAASNSEITGGWSTPVVDNSGTVIFDHVRLAGILSTSALLTTGDGSSVLRSSTLVAPATRFPAGGGTACGGTQPISLGYNTAWGASCVLTGPGDQTGVNPYNAATRAPLIDKIPVGVNGCGDPGDADINGTTRPIDGDGVDGPACDIGATELPAP